MNNIPIAQDIQGTVYPNFQSFTHFAAPTADFQLGSNVLSFQVTDTGPPSALLVSSLTAAPEPAVWTAMLLGLGLAGAALRVNRQKASFSAI